MTRVVYDSCVCTYRLNYFKSQLDVISIDFLVLLYFSAHSFHYWIIYPYCSKRVDIKQKTRQLAGFFNNKQKYYCFVKVAVQVAEAPEAELLTSVYVKVKPEDVFEPLPEKVCDSLAVPIFAPV